MEKEITLFALLLTSQSQKTSEIKELRTSLQIKHEKHKAEKRQHRQNRKTAQQTLSPSSHKLTTLTEELVGYFISVRGYQPYWDDPAPNAKQIREAALENMRQFQALSPEKMREAFATMIFDQDLGMNEQIYVARELFKLMADHSPELGLDIFLEHRSTWSDYTNRSMFLPLVRGLAKKNPTTAIQWLENNREAIKGIDRFARRDVVAEIGKNNPARALATSKELKVNSWNVAFSLGSQARNAEQCIALLHAIKESEVNGLPSEKMRKTAIERMTRTVLQDGFAATQTLFENAQLTEEEKDIVISNLYVQPSGGLSQFTLDLPPAMPVKDTKKWLEWLGDNDTEKRKQTISGLISKWSEYSPHEVDEWISQQTEGPLKSTALKARAQPLNPTKYHLDFSYGN